MQTYTTTELKKVGQSGQISIGRKLAGKTLQVEYHEDGSIVLTPVVTVPESQLWTLQEPHKSRISRALEWAASNPAQPSNIDEVVAMAVKNGEK